MRLAHQKAPTESGRGIPGWWSRSRNVVALTSAVVLASGAVAYASSTPRATARTKKLTTITIAYPAPAADHMVPAVTEADGLFRKYGIQVKLVYLTQSLLLPELVSGQVQFATLAAPGYEIADLNGQPIEAIAQFEDTYDNELLSTAKYPTVQSLNGQTLAISTPGSQSDLLAHILERRFHITVHEEPLGSTTTQEAALESGLVAGKPDGSPTQLGAIEAAVPGIHVLLRWWKDLKNFPAVSFVGYEPWMRKHKDLVINALKAVNAGFVDFKSKTKERSTVNTIAKVTGVTTADALAGWKSALNTVTKNTLPSLKDEKQVFSYLKSEYPNAAHFNAAKVINASYDEAAGA